MGGEGNQLERSRSQACSAGLAGHRAWRGMACALRIIDVRSTAADRPEKHVDQGGMRRVEFVQFVRIAGIRAALTADDPVIQVRCLFAAPR